MNLLMIIACGLLLLIGVFIYAISRGRKTVRAYVYLMQVENGLDLKMANAIAGSLSTASAGEYRNAAMRHCHAAFNGSQLNMIKAARNKGFIQ
uniref:hypothetical protein n=1 Tax=Citrobacter freundii TaxID=546 RepID=UPI0020984921|nr:hypothetical protein [Citrobacter freundii]URZ94096.1 hypothetical protein [Citrobacter freundii]